MLARYFNVTELAGAIGVHKQTVRRLIRQRKLKAVNVSSGDLQARYAVEESEVERFMRERRV